MRRARIAELYNAGLPVADIAREMGVLPGTVHSLLTMMRRDGWDLPERRRHRELDDCVREPPTESADWPSVASALDAAIRRHWEDRDDDALYAARDRVVTHGSARLGSVPRTRASGLPGREGLSSNRSKKPTTRISYSIVRSCTEAVRVSCATSHSSTGSRAASTQSLPSER